MRQWARALGDHERPAPTHEPMSRGKDWYSLYPFEAVQYALERARLSNWQYVPTKEEALNHDPRWWRELLYFNEHIEFQASSNPLIEIGDRVTRRLRKWFMGQGKSQEN